MRSSGKGPAPARAVQVRRLDSGVIEVSFEGQVTDRTVESAHSLVLRMPEAPHFLLDALRVTGYEPSVRKPGVELLHTLRSKGVTYGVCLTMSSRVRLIGAAVSFVAGLRVDFVDSRAEAVRRMAAQRSATGLSD